jgi:hypothetical protein
MSLAMDDNINTTISRLWGSSMESATQVVRYIDSKRRDDILRQHPHILDVLLFFPRLAREAAGQPVRMCPGPSVGYYLHIDIRDLLDNTGGRLVNVASTPSEVLRRRPQSRPEKTGRKTHATFLPSLLNGVFERYSGSRGCK